VFNSGLCVKATIVVSLVSGVLSAQLGSGTPGVVRAAAPARTDLPELVTDRPDYTESTDIVGKGVFQLESGFTVERSQGGSSLSGPELLMRVGLSKRLELRLGGDGFLRERTPGGERTTGRSDFDLALKIRLFDQGRHRPAISLIPILSAPVGSAYFSSGGYDPTLKVLLSKDLAKGFSLGGNVNFSSLSTPQGRFRQTAWSASLGHEIGGGFGAYWEMFGFAPWDKDASAAWIANTGISRSIGKNMQVDVRVGKRLTDSGPNWFWGMGMAVRQPAWGFFR
jgi:hypothetical protein